MSTRIYVVTDLHAQPIKHRLVRASSQAQALNHVARSQYAIDVASQQTLVDLLAESVKIEDSALEAA